MSDLEPAFKLDMDEFEFEERLVSAGPSLTFQ